jgi:hypothetical protein
VQTVVHGALLAHHNDWLIAGVTPWLTELRIYVACAGPVRRPDHGNQRLSLYQFSCSVIKEIIFFLIFLLVGSNYFRKMLCFGMLVGNQD